MRRVFRPLVLAALFAASSLSAKTLDLVAPARGASLRGGSLATIEWRADQLPLGAEEWEAFLSVDGGRYYAFRITPHLDIELRRFDFLVPNVNTTNATILIRAGNEKRETSYEIPGTFTIAADPHARRIAPRLTRLRRGESAREGDPEVLGWAAGPRNGLSVTLESAPARHPVSLDAIHRVAGDSLPILAPDDLLVRTREIVRHHESTLARPRFAFATLARTVDLLLVCRRRNI